MTATVGAPETAALEADPVDRPDTRDAPPSPRDARPGYCSEHPNVRLVVVQRIPGWSRWDDRRDPVLCPDDAHTSLDRERCVYCGRFMHRLGSITGWRYGSRRTTCSETCRNYLWRWRRLQSNAAAAGRSVAP